MPSIIKISKCDNELILIAYQGSSSFEICRILSGNNNPVDVTVNIYAGQFQGTLQLDGIQPARPLTGSYNVSLAAGTYSLVAVGIDWGGPLAFAYTLNGTAAAFVNTGQVDGVVSYTKATPMTI